jgi:hypothetical protein
VPRIRASVLVNAPPKVVWAAIEDIASHTDWMLDAVAIRFVGDQRRGVGTAFDCDTRIGPFRLTDRMTITEWRDGKVMGVDHAGLVTGSGRFTVTKVRRHRDRTRFTWDERLRFPWWFGGPVGALGAKAVLTMVWRRNLRNLKRLVEGP